MKNIKILFLFILFFFVSCTGRDILILSKARLQKVHTISLRRVEIHSLIYDPFIKKDITELLKFHLEKSGYEVVNYTPSTNTNISLPKPDAFLDVVLIHKRYLKNIKETDNITFKIDIEGPDNKKLVSALISDTASHNLLNTQTLGKYIEKFITQLKKKIKK